MFACFGTSSMAAAIGLSAISRCALPSEHQSGCHVARMADYASLTAQPCQANRGDYAIPGDRARELPDGRSLGEPSVPFRHPDHARVPGTWGL
jgi:hypothetical protein